MNVSFPSFIMHDTQCVWGISLQRQATPTLLRIRWRRSPKEIGIPRWLRVEASFIIESSLEDRAACLPLPRLHGEPRTPLSLFHSLSFSRSVSVSVSPPSFCNNWKALIHKYNRATSATDLIPRLYDSNPSWTHLLILNFYKLVFFLVQGEGKVTIFFFYKRCILKLAVCLQHLTITIIRTGAWCQQM